MFHFIRFYYFSASYRAVDVDDDGDSHSSLGSRDCDCEEREHHTLHLLREEEAVENCKVEIGGIQHQLERYQHRDHILPGDKPIDAADEHYDAGHEIPKNVKIHFSKYNLRVEELTFAGHCYSADDAGEQKHADSLEGEKVLIFVCAGEGFAYHLHRHVGSGRKGVGK